MKTPSRSVRLVLAMFLFSVLVTPAAEAQRMKHSAPRPSASRGKSSGGNRSINGGAQRAQSRPATKPATSSRAGSVGSGGGGTQKKLSGDGSKKANVGNKTNAGNKVNVDKSRGDININVDNSTNISRNTRVNRNTHVYNRPPYRYGGHAYYCYHPYYYHPYHPYYWGPVWHPWGFFVATLAATAVVVSVSNQQYHYDQGVYYQQSGNGYTVVPAPVGATVTTLPDNAQTVVVNETTNNYYYGGAYYEKTAGGFTVVAPTAGTVVEDLPEGGEEVRIGDVTYVKFGDTYYQPIQKDGKEMYEVVQVEESQS